MSKFHSGFEPLVKPMIKEFLTSTDWLVQRHKEQLDTETTTSLTAEEYVELISYRQYLRQLSSQTEFDDSFEFQEFGLRDRYCEAQYLALANLFETK